MDRQFLRKYTRQSIDKSGNTLMHKAVKERDQPLLRRVALMETSVNKQNKDGYSALHYAVKHGEPTLVEVVLQCGVSPLLKTKLGETAKDIANRNKATEILKLLDLYGNGLEHCILNRNTSGAIDLLNKWVNLGNVARSATTSQQGPSFKENLASMGLDFYLQQNHFIHLVGADDYEEVSAILNGQEGARPYIDSVHSSSLATPLSLAIQNYNVKMINLLLNCGANPSVRLLDGTPLTHYSWNLGAPFQIILCLLRDKHIWHMRAPPDDLTILFSLVASPSITTVHTRKLLEVTDCELLKDRDPEGLDIYEFCMLHNRSDIVESIYESLVELLSKSNGKLRLVGLAVVLLSHTIFNIPEEVFLKVYDDRTVQSMIEVYKQFKENISSLEEESQRLFDAVRRGDLMAVKRHNVADFVNKRGRTALHEAIINDNFDIAVWLLAERPQLQTIGDLKNRYPLHYAYGVSRAYGKKYVHLLLESVDREAMEKLTDVENNIPSALMIV